MSRKFTKYPNSINASIGVRGNNPDVDAISDYLDRVGAYAFVVDTWTTTSDGTYALVNEYGDAYVLRYKDGIIYNVNNDDCYALAKNANNWEE